MRSGTLWCGSGFTRASVPSRAQLYGKVAAALERERAAGTPVLPPGPGMHLERGGAAMTALAVCGAFRRSSCRFEWCHRAPELMRIRGSPVSTTRSRAIQTKQ